MDETVQLHLRRIQLQSISKKRGPRPSKKSKATVGTPGSPEPGKTCSYCDAEGTTEDPILPCITYPERSPTTVTPAFFNEPGCDQFVHLSCVRKLKGADGIGDDPWKGSVPIAEAQYQLIGFCGPCFANMESNRPEAERGGATTDHH